MYFGSAGLQFFLCNFPVCLNLSARIVFHSQQISIRGVYVFYNFSYLFLLLFLNLFSTLISI